MKNTWMVEDYGVITGSTLLNAVEKNFEKIAYFFKVGNIAGHKLFSVRLEYDPYLFCDSWYGDKPSILFAQCYNGEKQKQALLKQMEGVKLVVTAVGLDDVFNFDPTKIITIIKIHASKEDFPEGKHEFEINKNAEEAPLTKIEARRKYIGMSRAELSRLSGVPLRTLEDWARRKYKPTDIYKLLQIAKILNCNLDDLIEP